MADEEILEWNEYIKTPEYLRYESRSKKAAAISRRVEQRRTRYLSLASPAFRGLQAAVNKCYFAQLSRHKWLVWKRTRAFHAIRYVDPAGRRMQPLAHEVFELELGTKIPRGLIVVTKDRRGLDCRIENLEILTVDDYNGSKDEPNSLPEYEGVIRHCGTWKVRRTDTKGNMNCEPGEYATQLDAVIARDATLQKDWHRVFPNLVIQQ